MSARGAPRKISKLICPFFFLSELAQRVFHANNHDGRPILQRRRALFSPFPVDCPGSRTRKGRNPKTLTWSSFLSSLPFSSPSQMKFPPAQPQRVYLHLAEQFVSPALFHVLFAWPAYTQEGSDIDYQKLSVVI